MSELRYEVTARSAAPPEAVFALLADAPRWHEWAGPFVPKSMWAKEGDPAPGGVGAVRKLGAPPFWSLEEIVAYEPPRHLAYVLVSGLPVKDYRADVDLVADGAATIITWRGRFQPGIPGTGPVMQAFLKRIVGGFARRLAAAAGTVTP